MTRKRVLLNGAIALLGVGAFVTWLLGSRPSEKTYDTPLAAVVTTCHAARILGDFSPARSARIRIGWQEKGQPPGIGWTALVVHANDRYAVSICKFQSITHG